MMLTDPDSVAGRLVALIRGINVGRAKRVPMAKLRALVVHLGYTDVRTLLNSGNVVFTDSRSAPTDAAERIEKEINSRLGVSARVTVLTVSDFDKIVRDNPLLDVADNFSRLLVAVLATSADRNGLEPLLETDWAPGNLALGARVAYVWCPDGVLASPLNNAIGRAVGDSVTTRTWRTILKIHAAIHDEL